jgi:hypothetical protein
MSGIAALLLMYLNEEVQYVQISSPIYKLRQEFFYKTLMVLKMGNKSIPICKTHQWIR